MGTFIEDGAAVLPPTKSNSTFPTGLPTEWAADDANQVREALLDVRTAVIEANANAGPAATGTNPYKLKGQVNGVEPAVARTPLARASSMFVSLAEFGTIMGIAGPDTTLIQTALAWAAANGNPWLIIPPETAQDALLPGTYGPIIDMRWGQIYFGNYYGGLRSAAFNFLPMGATNGMDPMAENIYMGLACLRAHLAGLWTPLATIAIGNNVLYNNPNPNHVLVMGQNAMAQCTSGGDSSVALGGFALNGAGAIGTKHVAVGFGALTDNTTGNSNIAIGYYAGKGISTGSGNVIIGCDLAALSGALTNNIILASGTVIRVQYDTTNGWVFNDRVKASNLTGGATTLSVDANGYIIRTPSDERLKDDVKPIESATEKVLAMNPVSFVFKPEAGMGEGRHVGFIAQQMEQVVPEVVSSSTDGIKSLNYGELVAVLTKTIQEQEARIKALEAKLGV